MRYWPNYNLIWEIDQCELSYDGEDSEGGEDLESGGEGAGANNTTNSTNTQGNSLHVDNGSSSESSIGGDEDEYETPTSSPVSTPAKPSTPVPTSLAKEVRSAKATTNKNAGPMAKKAGIRKTYVRPPTLIE